MKKKGLKEQLIDAKRKLKIAIEAQKNFFDKPFPGDLSVLIQREIAWREKIDALKTIKRADKKKRKKNSIVSALNTKKCLDYYNRMRAHLGIQKAINSALKKVYEPDFILTDTPDLKREMFYEFEIDKGHEFTMNNQLFTFDSMMSVSGDRIKIRAKKIEL